MESQPQKPSGKKKKVTGPTRHSTAQISKVGGHEGAPDVQEIIDSSRKDDDAPVSALPVSGMPGDDDAFLLAPDLSLDHATDAVPLDNDDEEDDDEGEDNFPSEISYAEIAPSGGDSGEPTRESKRIVSPPPKKPSAPAQEPKSQEARPDSSKEEEGQDESKKKEQKQRHWTLKAVFFLFQGIGFLLLRMLDAGKHFGMFLLNVVVLLIIGLLVLAVVNFFDASVKEKVELEFKQQSVDGATWVLEQYDAMPQGEQTIVEVRVPVDTGSPDPIEIPVPADTSHLDRRIQELEAELSNRDRQIRELENRPEVIERQDVNPEIMEVWYDAVRNRQITLHHAIVHTFSEGEWTQATASNPLFAAAFEVYNRGGRTTLTPGFWVCWKDDVVYFYPSAQQIADGSRNYYILSDSLAISFDSQWLSTFLARVPGVSTPPDAR